MQEVVKRKSIVFSSVSLDDSFLHHTTYTET